ncbi:hypothetical protein A2326_03745 [candidate division WWE3 bacterium RIFOXYB2_FULL_41_6]|nr:MAG: hypothetical protein A2326_03745 [candidate division WWE3 bacterium RIFOXYB2_FULL_41_6]OGW31146.1 MAG: hypothetical protein A2X54_01895 [Nitrospirae bacterium GWF2_44_13]OGW63976.1 MAG: hypothetical protein A2222_01895 [Nitrospirae bacterium RIFOXYA2_FULL_44_9]HBG92968.1 hypothetical protein [Nitrospiraceae bacterium]
MSLRAKLTVFTTVFFLITAVLIAGSFLIFSRLSNTFDIQRSFAKEHNLNEDLRSSIVSVVLAAEGWTVTGDVKFQRQYKKRLKEAYTFFNELPEAVRNKEEVKAIRADFDKMEEFAGAIIAAKQPVGDIPALFALRMLKDKEREAYEKLGAIHSESVLKLTNTIAQGESIERQMGFYLVALFGLSSLAFMSLIIFMKRIITAPFDGLMKATEKISEGELDYRIDSGRRDEFGIIADRFDEMIEKLQRSILKNAELYEIARLRERQAVEARKRMEILFDGVQGGIVTVGRGYEIISATRFVKGWTDMTVEEMIGKNALDVFHDKEGICPHCVAKTTFETGQINSITQSRGLNYAELTSYPIKDDAGNVIECVVFIEDITDRVLYNEEILSLYKEVAQTKEYLESLIENSADAIVTSDLEGNITSWNYGAERTFGYKADEAAGKFLPFVPLFLVDAEKEYIGKIKSGETLKDIETLRQRKDGTIIEASLTLSPIKDTAGEVIGISGITRDISERKRVEKELIRRNQELSRLFFISSAMSGTLELDRLLRMVLTAVTMSDGLGFNRSILFLIDEKKGTIKGAMGVGPASSDEAWKIWEKLSIERKTLPDILHDIETGPLRKDSFLDRLSMGMELSLKDETILTRAVKEKKAFNVPDVKEEPMADAVLIQQLGTQAYAVVPLVSRDRVIGVLWVDNLFTRRLITDEDMKFLVGFSNQIASAVENARLFDQVARAEAELENIFRSISDMVYITDKDYTIKNVNKAVVDRIGKSAGEIIGEKCYRIFHGMDEPFHECPHHKTVQTMEAYIEEVKDSYLGGTFLTSVSPVFNKTGEFMGTVHVVGDVTELNNLREKLVATERLAGLGEVAAKVAHEIRNPLVSVGGFAKRLEKKLDGNLKEYAGIIVREVDRLESILREILGFVKEVRLMKEKVNVGELVDDMISLMQTELRESDIKVLNEKGETPQIYVDANRIREALLNIFNNAVQVLTIHGTITIKTYTAGSNAVIEISDTGPGIEEKDLPFIFNPFYTTKLSGTGLGLAITKRIIEEHKGKIEVDSAPGKGTTFRVFLPG